MNYLSYFLILNFALLLIYGILAYRYRSFSRVKFRFSGFVVVKLLIRFCLINLFIYLLIQFSSIKNSFNSKQINDFEAILVSENSFNQTFDEDKLMVFSNQIGDNYSSYKLMSFDKEKGRLALVIPKTSYLSFLTYLRNKDLKNVKTIYQEDLPFLKGVKDKSPGFYVRTHGSAWDQISIENLAKKQEYLGFNSNLDLYLLILLSILLLSELFLSFQIIKY